MNLLQISEPKESLPVDLSTIAVGIDLGTTNSVIAYSNDAKPIALGPLLPSIYKDIRSIKRLMGKNKKIDQFHPEEISAEILKKLVSQGEKIINKSITKAVITVPAHFDDAARAATKMAANLAGIEVLRLINEPTAAAIAYGLDAKAEGTILVYDFGGGTFDVSLLKIQKGVFQVISTAGDSNLGGDDIDHIIMKHLNLPDDLYYIAKEAKEYLSNHQQWKSEYGNLSLTELNYLIKDLVNKTIAITLRTIDDAKLTIQEIDAIVLVGGSTRLQLVKELISREIKEPLDNIDPDRVVALGAAIQAEALTRGSNTLLIDVNSLSIGLEVYGGLNEKIINRNSPLPASVTKYFTTYQDNQTGITFNIVQGEREMASDCRSIVKFELKGIPPMKAGMAKVAATFLIDCDGLLTITAIEERSGLKKQLEVKANYGLSRDDIEIMINDAYKNAEIDINLKKLTEVRIASKNIINNLNIELKENQLVDIELRNKILKLIDNLENALMSDDIIEITENKISLESESAIFIQECLNRKIKNILQGTTC